MNGMGGTAESFRFDSAPSGAPGELIRLSPLIRRMVAPNPSPMTFTGTCTYVVGQGQLAIIDPGPDHAGHVRALLAVLRSETVAAILVTHTHRDHSPAARALKAATGAPIIGCAPASTPARGEGPSIDAANDEAHAPDAILREGEAFEGAGFSLVCVETPGHAKNHLAFALPQEKALFSGDHVMAWSTTVVVPPDGKMRHYLASLTKLLARTDQLYWPGHGGPVPEPHAYVRALLNHRRSREKSILAAVESGDHTVAAITGRVYKDLNPALIRAAGLSVVAHLEHLMEQGLIRAEGRLGPETLVHPA